MKLLLIEDNPVTVQVIRDMLSAAYPDTFELECNTRLDTGIESLTTIRPDVVILDLNLPDSTGVDTVLALINQAPHIPIVVLTAIDDEKIGLESVKRGAQDYLIKGEVTKELLARSLTYAFERKRMEEELKSAHEGFQVLLKDRTAELSRTNRELQEEIAEKKKTEERLLSLLKAVESMQIGVTITDLAGNIVYTNPYEAEIHGYTVEELIGKPARIFAGASAEKPMTAEKIKTMKGFTRETTNVKKDGTIFPVNLISDVVKNENGQPIYIVSTSTDITERKKMEQELTRLSITDDLTGLFNQRHFRRKLDDEIKRAGRAGSPLTLLIFDLDSFKKYNDTYGHLMGDEVLREVGRITKGAIRSGADSAFRYGGDEFAIILPYTEPENAHQLGVRINEQVAACFPEIGISFGIARFADDTSLQELIDTADKAMYQHKAGKPA
ncbi:MAG: diguanylate cyclase [Deltaproteobacteria bacterium]|nr:diguanylate cyclase [Candidatus Zymogenaceae bacterium]